MAGARFSVAGVVCPVAVLTYTALGEIHSVAGVVCPVAGVIYSVSGGAAWVIAIPFGVYLSRFNGV